MKIDQDYLIELLNAFQNEERLYTDIGKLKAPIVREVTAKEAYRLGVTKSYQRICYTCGTSAMNDNLLSN